MKRSKIYLTILAVTVIVLIVRHIPIRRDALHDSDKEAMLKMDFIMTGLAIHSDQYGRLPAPRTPCTADIAADACSWRVLIFRLLHPYGAADQSAPDDGLRPVPKVSEDFCIGLSPQTFVFAVTGNDTAFGDEGEVSKSLKQLPPNLILIAEVCESAHSWSTVGDFVAETMEARIGCRGCIGTAPSRLGFCVGFADRQIWLLRRDTPFSIIKSFLTVSGARSHDRNKSLAVYRLRSFE